MGWFSTSEGHEGHEGYLVALVREPGSACDAWPRVRELGRRDAELGKVRVAVVQVACDCGWRSPRLHAPSGTEWFPVTVDAPAGFEELAARIWREHLASIVANGTTGRLGVDGPLLAPDDWCEPAVPVHACRRAGEPVCGAPPGPDDVRASEVVQRRHFMEGPRGWARFRCRDCESLLAVGRLIVPRMVRGLRALEAQP